MRLSSLVGIRSTFRPMTCDFELVGGFQRNAEIARQPESEGIKSRAQVGRAGRNTKSLFTLQHKPLVARAASSRFQTGALPVQKTFEFPERSSFPGMLPCAGAQSLPGYRPCRKRRRPRWFRLTGESSTFGNIPTGVALISRSQGLPPAPDTSSLERTRTIDGALTAAMAAFAPPPVP